MKKVFTIFAIILISKVFLSFFINSLLVFPDESCFFLKAKHFSNTLSLENCSTLSSLEVGNPYPLYSIIISPVFLFFENLKALKSIFIINILLTTLIFFPIFEILKNQIKNLNKSLFFATILTLLPTITAYERMLMSESLFIFLGIFCFYYYQKSILENKLRPKLISFFLSFLAIFTRPFGFILIISLLINDLFISKNKKIKLLIFFFTIILIFFAQKVLLPNATYEIQEKIASLKDFSNYSLILKSIKNQINSLSIETFFIPTLILFTYLLDKKDKIFKKTRFFFITFISLNLIISSQHIYKYLLSGVANLDLSTRYLNLSILFIILCFFIIIEKSKKIKSSPYIFLLLIIPLFFLTFKEINHALNITLSPYYEVFNGIIKAKTYFIYIFTPLIFLLFTLLTLKKKNLIIYSISLIFILQTIILSFWHINYSKIEEEKEEYKYFKNQQSKILLVKSLSYYKNSAIRPVYFDYFRIKTLTSNQINIVHFNDIKELHDETNQEWKNLIKDYNYIISPYPLTLKKVGETSTKDSIYLNK